MSKKVVVQKQNNAKHINTLSQNFYHKPPIWSFQKCDIDHPRWGFCNTTDSFYHFIKKLKDYEGLLWKEIMQISGGRKSGTNNHFEFVAELIPEAKMRWKELRLEEYDSVFSLRLTGRQRLYGILVDGIFFVVWYDRCHEIYPIKK